MREPLPIPVTVCTRCYVYNGNNSLIGYPCGIMIDGKRCKGTWGSALDRDDWKECQSCNATNYTCDSCNGEGWEYIGKYIQD